MTKIKNGIMKDQFETVILHVGTNYLVHKDPELVATKMDRLITETKSKGKKGRSIQCREKVRWPCCSKQHNSF